MSRARNKFCKLTANYSVFEIKIHYVVDIHMRNPLTFECYYQVLCSVAILSVSVLLPMHVAPFPVANIFLLLIDQSILSQAVLRDLPDRQLCCYRRVLLFSHRFDANVSPCNAIVGLTFCSAEILRITNDTTCRMVIKKEKLIASQYNYNISIFRKIFMDARKISVSIRLVCL